MWMGLAIGTREERSGIGRQRGQLPGEGASGRKSKGNRLCYSFSLAILALFKKKEKTKHRLALTISDG